MSDDLKFYAPVGCYRVLPRSMRADLVRRKRRERNDARRLGHPVLRFRPRVFPTALIEYNTALDEGMAKAKNLRREEARLDEDHPDLVRLSIQVAEAREKVRGAALRAASFLRRPLSPEEIREGFPGVRPPHPGRIFPP